MPTSRSSSTAVHLHAGGTSVLLHQPDTALPEVLHWGADLGDLTEQAAAAIARASVPVVGSNDADVPVRVALLPEQHAGFSGRPGLSGSRAGRAWSPKFRVTDVRLDGRQASGFVDQGAGSLVVSATDEESDLELLLELELLADGVLRTRAGITNLGEAYEVESLTPALPVPARAEQLLDFAGRWCREKVPQRLPFVTGTHLREGRKGRTGADAAGILHAGEAGFGFATGEVWGVHAAWSGNHIHYAERTFDGHRLLGAGELLLPGEVVLERDDSYTGPWVYGVHGFGLDEVAAAVHSTLRARPQHPATPRKVTLNVWEAVYFDHSLPRLLDLTERAANLGVERLVLDDGWFGGRRDDTAGLGDWVVSPDVWPQGLHPLVDRVRGLGMEFGLWFEPEMVNADSDVARAHPEWIMGARQEQPVISRHQQVLDLGIPEAYAHVRDQMMALLDEYEIGYLKWDHNRDLVEAGDRTRGGRPAVHEQTLATYRLMAELKAAHPGLEIESCSSGGGRVDLGVMEVCDRVWVSDCIDPLERQQMQRWTGQLLPPELCGSHVGGSPSHTTGRRHSLNFRAATAFFGHFGIEWDLAEADETDLSQLAEWVDLHRRMRPLLHSSTTVRLDAPGDGVLVHGVVSPTRQEALFAYVLTGHPLENPTAPVRLRGLDPAATYRIRPLLVTEPSGLQAPAWWGTRDDDGYPGAELTGAALMQVGFRPPGMHPDEAVLFHLQARPEDAS